MRGSDSGSPSLPLPRKGEGSALDSHAHGGNAMRPFPQAGCNGSHARREREMGVKGQSLRRMDEEGIPSSLRYFVMVRRARGMPFSFNISMTC